MPKKFPPEFKRDVVAVVRRGGLTRVEVAADFGISETTLARWIRQADVDDGIRDGLTSAEQAEVVQLRRDKRRLEMENEILRRAARSRARRNPLALELDEESVHVATTDVLGRVAIRWLEAHCAAWDFEVGRGGGGVGPTEAKGPTLKHHCDHVRVSVRIGLLARRHTKLEDADMLVLENYLVGLRCDNRSVFGHGHS